MADSLKDAQAPTNSVALRPTHDLQIINQYVTIS
jgi:hypothetical protein